MAGAEVAHGTNFRAREGFENFADQRMRRRLLAQPVGECVILGLQLANDPGSECNGACPG